MTPSLTDWLLQKDERNSRSYDFNEARPLWKFWLFRIIAGIVCLLLIWFFLFAGK
jgi:hypothetical protein